MTHAANNRVDPIPCKLALADGTVVAGNAIGHIGETGGEICFNTSMTGYQEVMTDPSYHGQIMMMTYPHIGNYGTAEQDMEAGRPMIAGFVVRAFSRTYSNFAAEASLDAFMKEHELVGITGVDTRTLVRHLRTRGVMNAIISSVDQDDRSLVQKAKDWPSMEGLELASRVTIDRAYDFSEGDVRIAVYDYGVKLNILRSFRDRGCAVRVFPAGTPLHEVLDWRPDGLFFSNGPGDPRAMPDAVDTVKGAIATAIPIFGICLGHQLMGLAAGLDVYKMYVGHRGANHPVKNVETQRVEVTTQNHGFGISRESLREDIAVETHVNLNDDTLEGLRFRQFEGMSVQYHPEASPGPHDSRYLFDQFLTMIANATSRRASAAS